VQTKTVAIRTQQFKLYRCRRCYIPTWVSNLREHRHWHRRKEERSKQFVLGRF